jgi:hypothetical protein
LAAIDGALGFLDDLGDEGLVGVAISILLYTI